MIRLLSWGDQLGGWIDRTHQRFQPGGEKGTISPQTPVPFGGLSPGTLTGSHPPDCTAGTPAGWAGRRGSRESGQREQARRVPRHPRGAEAPSGDSNVLYYEKERSGRYFIHIQYIINLIFVSSFIDNIFKSLTECEG